MIPFNKGAASGLFAGMMNPYASKEPVITFYPDEADPKKWRWRIYFSSDIVAASSQGYVSKELAKENLLKIEQHIKHLREQNLI